LSPQIFQKIRQAAIACWLIAVAGGMAYYLTNRDAFGAAQIAGSLRQFSRYMLVAYLAVSVSRAFVLIPSTPFVVAGALLLPDQPRTVLGISMLGIALSATLIYFLSEALGFRRYFERAHGPSLRRVEEILRGKTGFACLVGWAFFPFAPTDAACYVAGIVRMRFWKFLSAVCLGELVICSFYVYVGRGVWDWMLAK
jgi:uncharacterized membrane protein YdjX (TVP38/TMEM64 family)